MTIEDKLQFVRERLLYKYPRSIYFILHNDKCFAYIGSYTNTYLEIIYGKGIIEYLNLTETELENINENELLNLIEDKIKSKIEILDSIIDD